MQREIQIGTKMVPMRATASTSLRYKAVFRGDLLTELARKKPEAENVPIVQQLAFIMSKSAEGANMNALTLNDYIDWLDQFETLDLVEALPAALDLYMESAAPSSEAKKNDP